MLISNATNSLKLTLKVSSVPVEEKMIIPIRCMNCGCILADKWRYYQRRLKELRPQGTNNTIYMDGTSVPDTAERKIFEELGLKRYCCRKHILTHVDLIEKN